MSHSVRPFLFFRRMEPHIDDGYRTPRIEDAVDRAIPLLQSVESNHDVQVEATNTIFTMAYVKVTDMQTELTRSNVLKK